MPRFIQATRQERHREYDDYQQPFPVPRVKTFTEKLKELEETSEETED